MSHLYSLFISALLNNPERPHQAVAGEIEILNKLAYDIIKHMIRGRCPVCGKKFARKYTLKSHLTSRLTPCSSVMKSLFLKLYWVKTRISENIREYPTHYRCKICGVVTLTRTAMIHHILDEHQDVLQPAFDHLRIALMEHFGITTVGPENTRYTIRIVRIEADKK